MTAALSLMHVILICVINCLKIGEIRNENERLIYIHVYIYIYAYICK